MASPYHRGGMSGASGGKNPAGKPAPVKIVEKSAFPKASLPGKAQPRDRSAGVARAKTYVKSEGV